MDWITTSGTSIDEAKGYALDQLGIVADEAEFEVVNDVQKGLFGRVKEEARVRARVRPKQPAAKDDRGNRRRNGGGGRGRGSRSRGGQGQQKQGNQKQGGNRNDQGGGSRNKGNQKQGQQKQGQQKQGNQGGRSQNKSKNNDKNQGKAESKQETADSSKRDNRKKDNVEQEFSREEQERTGREFLEGLLDTFGMSGEVAVTEAEDDGAIELGVTGQELGLLVGQKGTTLNALQELTRTVVQREADGAKTDRLRVDVAGYRARRAAALQDFARKIAAEVVDSGNEKVLEPMGSADRKVVHDALTDMEGVETGSEGEEPRRRVVIRPA